MEELTLLSLASILVLGIGAQWLAWRIKLPVILLLLIAGFLAGPVFGFLDPDHLLGETLFPIVSLAVAIILFEGGLTLKLDELRDIGRVVRLLVTIGVLITWALATVGGIYFLNLEPILAAILGAILTVSGPTVVIPLLRHVRPSTRVASILKWEGIMIDPVGATLAVLVFEVLAFEPFGRLTLVSIFAGVAVTLIVGFLIGAAGAYVTVFVIERRWLPHYLETAASLMIVVAAFALSNLILAESGLMAVTVMGVILANQHRVAIQHIANFDEELGILLLSALFIILSARLELSEFTDFGIGNILFLALLIFIARPLAVFVTTLGTPLNWREKLFISWVAPRGIVAAAVASLFAFELHELGFEDAERLVSITFTVVVGTVAVYALTARPVAAWLDVIQKNPQGTLIVGAHHWAVEIGKAIQDAGFEVIMVDSNRDHVSDARSRGLNAISANILGDDLLNELPFERIGRLLAMTSNSELNALAALRYRDLFGRDNIYQLTTDRSPTSERIRDEIRAEILFDKEMDFDHFESWYMQDATIQHHEIDDELSHKSMREYFGPASVPLFVVRDDTHIEVISAYEDPDLEIGQRFINFVHPSPEQAKRLRELLM